MHILDMNFGGYNELEWIRVIMDFHAIGLRRTKGWRSRFREILIMNQAVGLATYILKKTTSHFYLVLVLFFSDKSILGLILFERKMTPLVIWIWQMLCYWPKISSNDWGYGAIGELGRAEWDDWLLCLVIASCRSSIDGGFFSLVAKQLFIMTVMIW